MDSLSFNRVSGKKSLFTGTRRFRTGSYRGKTLFPIEEAAERGTLIMFLLSDAGQMAAWPKVKPHLKGGGCPVTSRTDFDRLQKTDQGDPAEKHRRDHGCAQRLARSCEPTSWMGAESTPVCRVPGFHRQSKERTAALGIAIWVRRSFPTHLCKRGFTAISREKGVCHGLPRRGDEAQYDLLRKKRPFSERGIQRNRLKS